MPNCQNQHDIVTREPTMLCDITIAPAREDELAAALFGFTAQQWMIGQQFERATHAQEVLAGPDGTLFCEEIEEALEIPKRLAVPMSITASKAERPRSGARERGATLLRDATVALCCSHCSDSLCES
jgi:hypothetical protein